ncbi:unnamed protein product [Euphydryas editha]|uniref:Uncharacterized protein n=1 Tax=Euphydryas editha TaxID=104508 RepID=A0AAU9VG08_EUPED|nr:unnamed protein product [Euphydryas editha]
MVPVDGARGQRQWMAPALSVSVRRQRTVPEDDTKGQRQWMVSVFGARGQRQRTVPADHRRVPTEGAVRNGTNEASEGRWQKKRAADGAARKHCRE